MKVDFISIIHLDNDISTGLGLTWNIDHDLSIQQWTLTFDDYLLPIIARSIKLAKERAAGEHLAAVSRKLV